VKTLKRHRRYRAEIRISGKNSGLCSLGGFEKTKPIRKAEHRTQNTEYMNSKKQSQSFDGVYPERSRMGSGQVWLDKRQQAKDPRQNEKTKPIHSTMLRTSFVKMFISACGIRSKRVGL
jgi:hypothetical protein